MIRVTFTDSTSKTYRIGCKRLGQPKWHYIEYRASFKTIAEIIGTKVEQIESWSVI